MELPTTAKITRAGDSDSDEEKSTPAPAPAAGAEIVVNPAVLTRSAKRKVDEDMEDADDTKVSKPNFPALSPGKMLVCSLISAFNRN